ncbi:MAG: isopentenyl-diphosphate Delta-isomerase [Calditrichaeota bacterium]|nr:isopentenyl-diphosphate Delta-isomerase [Calditrichota bacterium]
MTDHPRVSFDSEELILVNEHDQVVGYLDKASCHQGQGILHRAFSIFIFNDKGQLLLQQRSGQKPLWPLFWSNSCCSHPRKGETTEDATQRRLLEELGFTTPLTYLYKFIYQAPFEDKGAEHELCYVYVGKYSGPVKVNPNEIAEWKFMDVEELDRDMAEHPERYTPWFKMEWERIRKEFWDVVQSL